MKETRIFTTILLMFSFSVSVMAQDIVIDCGTETTICHPESCSGYYDIYEYFVKTYVTSDPEKILGLEFTHFDLETNYDYLYVYDGASTEDPLIGEYTGTSLPPDIFSSGPYLTLEFYSDDVITATGYSAILRCYDETSLTEINRGEILDLCFPFGCTGPYAENMDTIFAIQSASSDQVLRVIFEDFDLPDPDDILEIYDGYSTGSPLLGTFTGTELPDTIFSSGSVLTFRFVSDASVAGNGWKASIQGIYLVPEEAYNTYYIFTGETMVFRASDPSRALLASIYLYVGGRDTVWIHDGDSKQAPVLLTSTLIDKNLRLNSSGPYMTIRSTDSEELSDMSLYQYSIEKPGPEIVIDCDLESTTHCFPASCTDYYGEYEHFVQTFSTSEPDSTLKLTFNRISIDWDDYLLIHDGESVSAPIITTYCAGCDPMDMVHSTGPSLTFEFHSDGETYGMNEGWEALFECDQALPREVVSYGEEKEICYPEECTGEYENNIEHIVVYEAEEQLAKLEVVFESFDTEDSVDFLEIYDGYSIDAPLIGRYSGSDLPEMIESSGWQLTFRFISNGSVVGTGWRAKVSCHHLISCSETGIWFGSTRNIKSYKLNGPTGTTLLCQVWCELEFQDTLFIFNGSSETASLMETIIGPYSSSYDGPIPFSSNTRYVTYRASVRDSLRLNETWFMFSCVIPQPEIEIDCNDPSNVICHPESCYGYYENNESFVQTYSTGGTGSNIVLEAVEFSLEEGFDFLSIYDGPTIEDPLIGEFTGTYIPESIITSGPYVTLMFNSDGSITDLGYRFNLFCLGGISAFESDSLALLALYNSTEGPSWNSTWDTTLPVGFWHGIFLSQGHVQTIDLSNNNLKGYLPDELCDLAMLVSLDLSNNQISGPIPECFGTQSELNTLDLSYNQLSGYLPEGFNQMENLSELNLSHNNLKGSLSSMILLNRSISYVNIRDNLFINVDRASNKLQELDIRENLLDFRDIQNNLDLTGIDRYEFDPQKPTGQRYLYESGDSHTVEPLFNRTSQPSDLSYSWYINNKADSNQDPTFTLENIEFANVGTYECRASHYLIEGFELSHIDTIEMIPGMPVVIPPDPFCSGSNNIIIDELSGGGQETLWFADSLLTDTIGRGRSIILPITGDRDTIYVVNKARNLLSKALQVIIIFRPTIYLHGNVLETDPFEGASYSWLRNGEPTGSDSHTLNLNGDGTYYVSVSLNGCRSTSRPAKIVNGEIVSLGDYSDQTLISVYPNPSEGMLYIDIPDEYFGDVVIRLRDLTGREVWNQYIPEKQARQEGLKVNIEPLPTGPYFMILQSADQNWVHLIIRK